MGLDSAPLGVEGSEVKLGRVGHYSYQEVCQTALITKVYPPAYDSESGDIPQIKVNVAGWTGDGDAFSRRGVTVGVSPDNAEGEFHFNRECPWNR